MPARTHVPSRQAVVVLLFGGLVVAVSLWAGQSVPRAVRSAQNPDATPAPSGPIPDAPEAIRLSTALFPAGKTPYGEVARLVTRLTFEVWSQHGVPGDPATPEADLFDWTGANPMSPVWLVGLLGADLTVADVLGVGAPPGVLLADLRDVPGAFYAWDANSAELIAQGAFLSGSGQTYDGLVAMADAPLTPQPATPWPTEPLQTPGPTQTWAPAELATAFAQLTAVPRSMP